MKKLLFSSVILAASVSAFSVTLYSNAVSSTFGGYYADANNSQAGYYGEVLANGFTLTSTSTIQQIQFTGSSDGYGSATNSDFSNFNIVVFNSTFGTVQDFTASVTSLTPTLTGRGDSTNGLEYVYTLNTNFSLGAGSYRLSVGANLFDPINGSYWSWSNGGPAAGTVYANFYDGTAWNTFTPNQEQAFTISGQPVPEPTSLAAVGLGLLVVARRRRKA